MQSGQLTIVGEDLTFTNYGKACSLFQEIDNRIDSLSSQGKEPTKEDIVFMLRTSLQARKYLSLYSERFYEKTVLW